MHIANIDILILLFLWFLYHFRVNNMIYNWIKNLSNKIYNHKKTNTNHNKFSFNAAHCMINRKDLYFISINYTKLEIYECFKNSNSSLLPVYDKNMYIIGIYSIKNFLDDVMMNKPMFSALSNVIFIPDSINVYDIINNFKKKIDALIVVDGFGSVVGIITNESLMKLIPMVLGLNDSIKMVDGVLFLDGKTFFDSISGLLDIPSFNNLTSITIGGIVTEFLGYIPKKGYQFSVDNYIIEIIYASGMQIERLKITPSNLIN